MTTPVPEVLIDERDGVLRATLNRPEKLNALTPAMTAGLWTAVEALGRRSDIRALVITGSGRYFCAGIDLATGHGARIPGREATGFEYRYGYRSHHKLYDEIESIEKPVILAANGSCLGAGAELAVSCDFRFCTPQADWRFPETGLGLIPGSGGLSRLTRLVGTQWAKWMALAGQNVTAAQAREIGLVHEVCPDGTLENRVEEFTRQLCALPSEAVALAKLVIDMCDPQDREKARNAERMANTDLRHRGSGTGSRGRFGASDAPESPGASEA